VSKAPQTNEEFLRREVDKLRRQVKRLKLIQGVVAEAATVALASSPPILVGKPQKHPKRKETEVAVAHLSDVQWGKRTVSYSSDLARARCMEFAHKVVKCIERHRHYANVDEIVLLLGGDMIEGEIIFAHQAHEIDQSVIDQALRDAPACFASIIFYFLEHVRRVRVATVPGNHGRVVPKHIPANPKANWDVVAYEVTQHIVEKSAAGRNRVAWQHAKDWYVIEDVLGHKLMMIHGHELRSSAHTSILSSMGGWIDSVQEEWHHLFIGHFHNLRTGYLNRRAYYINGTTESDAEYARQKLASAGRPVQRLQFWNKAHGMIADRPIYLDEGWTR